MEREFEKMMRMPPSLVIRWIQGCKKHLLWSLKMAKRCATYDSEEDRRAAMQKVADEIQRLIEKVVGEEEKISKTIQRRI